MKNLHDQLLEEVDAMLATMAGELNRGGHPSRAAVERVKSAVRQELHEQWLAAQASPPMRDGLLAEVQRDVRHEISRQAAWAQGTRRVRSSGRRPALNPRSLGALAAAAMMALCLGVIRQAGSLETAARARAGDPEMDAAKVQVNWFVEAAQVTLANDDFSNEVLSELDSIASQLPGSTGQRASTTLDDLSGALQDVLENSDTADDTMGRRLDTEGAIG